MVLSYNGALLTNKKEQTTGTDDSWMNLQKIMQAVGGGNQAQKVPYCVIVLIKHLYMTILQK
jgi:hypothetical protein